MKSKSNKFSKNNKEKRFKINEEKLKPLSPTLRQKKRYLKIKIESEKKFTLKELSQSLEDELIWLIGSINYSKAGIWIIKERFDEEGQEFVLRVDTKNKNLLCEAIALIEKIGNQNANLKIIKISGTLKKLFSNS